MPKKLNDHWSGEIEYAVNQIINNSYESGKKRGYIEASQYAHWVVGQFLEKDNRQLLMQLPGNIERGIKAP